MTTKMFGTDSERTKYLRVFNSLHPGYFYMLFLSSAYFVFQNNFFQKLVSNSMNPDQARHFVGPDLDPNCLPNLSADNIVCKDKHKNM